MYDFEHDFLTAEISGTVENSNQRGDGPLMDGDQPILQVKLDKFVEHPDEISVSTTALIPTELTKRHSLRLGHRITGELTVQTSPLKPSQITTEYPALVFVGTPTITKITSVKPAP